MKHNIINILVVLFLVVLCASSCKRDKYLIGGDLHQAKTNMTTYDYLKNQPYHIFDTLVMLIDAAGVKDLVNEPGITFFAPTDFSINAYLNRKAIEEQNIDPNRKYTLDSMMKYNLDEFKDSIRAYIVKQQLNFDDLTESGRIYPTEKPGDSVVVSFEPTNDVNNGYYPGVSTTPHLMYYTQLIGSLEEPFNAADISSDVGIREKCQTTGIETTTGMLNVLNNNHVLFFKQN